MSNSSEIIKKDDTENYKKWYAKEKKYFGKNDLIFRRWLEVNENNFKKDVSDIFNKLNIKFQNIMANSKKI